MSGGLDAERAKEALSDARVGRQKAAAILRTKKDALEAALVRTGARSLERSKMQKEISELTTAIGLLVKQN